MKAGIVLFWPALVLGLSQLQGMRRRGLSGILTAWMQHEREIIKPNVQPIPEPSKFEPFPYTSEALLEPFSQENWRASWREVGKSPLDNLRSSKLSSTAGKSRSKHSRWTPCQWWAPCNAKMAWWHC
ncbi:MAG: pilus assembly protein PilP [Burkholderiaceae bacterium]